MENGTGSWDTEIAFKMGQTLQKRTLSIWINCANLSGELDRKPKQQKLPPLRNLMTAVSATSALAI
jgi:hypothetical protein